MPFSQQNHPVRKAEPPDDTPGHAASQRMPDGTFRIRRFDLARQVLRHEGTRQAGFMANLAVHFTSRSRLPVIFQEGEAHRKQRAALAQFFSPQVVAARYRQLIGAESERLIGQLRAKGRANLDTLALDLTVAVAAELVGLTESDHAGLTKRISSFLDSKQSGQGWLSLLKALLIGTYRMVRFYVWDVRPAIRARRRERRADIISHLIDQGYSRREILTDSITYGAAGIATTRELIVMAAWYLFDHEDLLRRFLAAGENEREALIEEIFRLEPVVGALYRHAVQDVYLEDAGRAEMIPAGSLIAIDVRAANVDPQIAGKCPYHIEPSRQKEQKMPAASLMSFGDGRHRCPGSALALQETAIFLEQLFRVPGLRLEGLPAIEWNSLVESYELRHAIVTCPPADDTP